MKENKCATLFIAARYSRILNERKDNLIRRAQIILCITLRNQKSRPSPIESAATGNAYVRRYASSLTLTMQDVNYGDHSSLRAFSAKFSKRVLGVREIIDVYRFAKREYAVFFFFILFFFFSLRRL
ncbi:hypothetical protein PUN28_015674 [Cardiocondyla obscurior]|uniref:Uncharacterized protein n=1 Tax=Cardiocondyla obscurior TaxID=286306 RepID=A0AAW2EVZ8_9HYME